MMAFKKSINCIIGVFLYISCLNCWADSPVSAQFTVSGVSSPALENAQKSLTNCLPEERKHQHVTVKDIKECFAEGPTRITTALQPYGYFSARVLPSTLTNTKNKWQGHFTVIPGHRVYITDVSLRITGPGQNDPTLLKAVRDFPLKAGQAFESPAYEKARDQLLQTASEAGWLDAAYSTRAVRVSPEKRSAHIILVLETGRRFYFGQVTFGSSPFSQAFLDRFVSIHPDEPFSSEKLLKLQEDLGGSGYFRDITVTPHPAKAVRQKIPVTIMLQPPPARKYLIGVGYGTFTGPRTTLGADFRRIGDSGQHFTVQARLSTVLKGLSAKYFIPGQNPLTDKYVFGIEAQKFVPDNGRSLSENISASKIISFNEWQHTLSLRFLNERFQVESDPSESSRLLYPEYTLGWLKTDNMMNPRQATSIRMSLRGASDKILSFSSFVQGDIKAKEIFSPTKYSRVILRGGLGYTVVNDLSRLPLTLRYFAGGLDTVRGYAYSSIGPGRYLETAGLELQHRIIGDFSGAVFYDLGTATDHLNDNLMKGAGVGLIYHSAVGPIRLYVARALSKTGDPFRIEFSFGPDF